MFLLEVNFLFKKIFKNKNLGLKLKSKDSKNITSYDLHLMQTIPTVNLKYSEYMQVYYTIFYFFICLFLENNIRT